MPRKKISLSNLEWIDKHLGMRTDLAKNLLIPSKVAYNVKNWTPLKLIAIGYFAHMYTNIISKYFDRWLYCDLFAGSGVNLVSEKDYLPGSPFIVMQASKNNPFHHVFLIEMNPKRYEALSSRLEWVAENLEYKFPSLGSETESRCCYSIYNVSYEDFLSSSDFYKMFKDPDYKTHAFVVVDPEGFEIGWESLVKLFELPCDIFFSFMTTEIGRSWGKAKRGKEDYVKKMNTLFGDDIWKNADNREDILTLFIKKIEENDKIIVPIRIKSSRGYFFYDLLVITRKTRGGNPWLEAIYTLKNRIESSGASMVKSSLDYLAGRYKRLGDYF